MIFSMLFVLSCPLLEADGHLLYGQAEEVAAIAHGESLYQSLAISCLRIRFWPKILYPSGSNKFHANLLSHPIIALTSFRIPKMR